MKRIIIIILILIFIILIAGEVLVVKRNHAALREGPGSFYSTIYTLKKGAKVEIIEKVGKWYKVNYQNRVGFVSFKAFKQKNYNRNLEKMGETETEIEVSEAGMTAGVKGFAERISKKLKSDFTFLNYLMNYYISPKKYHKFKKKTYKKISLKKIQKLNPLPNDKETEEYTFPEQGLGYAIAAKLASMGIYKNEQLTDYLNLFGYLIVEVSDGFDQNFKFFVLDINNPNAYACPGGIIFVTKGMLKIIDNEAELACVIGHEIAHITRKHGMKEIERRINDIYAEKAFEELDKELKEAGYKQDEKIKLTEEELEKLSEQIYDLIVNGRLTKYEAEADRLGLLYAIRAGFDPNQMLKLLMKMKTKNLKSNNKHYSQSELDKRIKRIKKDLKKLKMPKKLLLNEKRARENLKGI